MSSATILNICELWERLGVLADTLTLKSVESK